MHANDLFKQVADDTRAQKAIETKAKTDKERFEREELQRKAQERDNITSDLLRQTTDTLFKLYEESDLFRVYLDSLFKLSPYITEVPQFTSRIFSGEEAKKVSEQLGLQGEYEVTGEELTTPLSEHRIILARDLMKDSSHQAKELVLIRELPSFGKITCIYPPFKESAVELASYNGGMRTLQGKVACSEGSDIEKALQALITPSGALRYLFNRYLPETTTTA